MADRICVIPRVHGVGGMVSFLHKFSDAAQARGIAVTNDLKDTPYSAVLVIGGTRDLLHLRAVRRRGVRIVQRLDGLNWIQRVRPVSLKHSLRAEYGNLLLSTVRRFLSERIIYQSSFSQWWWNRRFGNIDKRSLVIYNGVDLNIYSPRGTLTSKPDLYRLLVVEGSLGGGYENGLENAVCLAEGLAARGWPMEVQVVGEVSQALKSEWMAKSRVPVLWSGLVKREDIPDIDRSAHLLFSADVHPACPNSVVEALACGLPVVAFDTGSLTELVSAEAGFVGPYGSDSWKLQPPIIDGLVTGAESILNQWSAFSLAARKRAESLFGLEHMLDQYLEVLLG